MIGLFALFTAGWVGSIIVVLLSGIEDLRTVFSSDKPHETHQPIES